MLEPPGIHHRDNRLVRWSTMQLMNNSRTFHPEDATSAGRTIWQGTFGIRQEMDNLTSNAPVASTRDNGDPGTTDSNSRMMLNSSSNSNRTLMRTTSHSPGMRQSQTTANETRIPIDSRAPPTV